ncbi:Leucine carboxyl methyltransferase [Methanobrevibacter gottschalkii]|uniref:Leucine carboxyl methyltransferase n=1 Tax=Methanobrevibacter gottschalkii TaxID=190974 RepID=A0A1H7KGF5_9EURY|nr:class I SAM-dependent methyltransferase [Methanobrevibacter gottschalkii]MCQ2971667.1 class I SAM-dependent methyltransferase [archaeon]SEK85878.1 Leucine carboxyl methyltransferase [Methanobrevibacter gottschalkii]
MKEKVNLSGVSETMLVPLYSRALESNRKNPAFYDKTAIEIVKNLDYNFKERFKESKNKMNFWGCAARTIILDDEVSKYIKNNPECSVVNLACGLDDRFSRVDNGKINWYNIDFENIISLRDKLIDKKDRVTDIPTSALDFCWIDKIENKDNVLIIAEGFLMYLSEEDVKNLFFKISESFGKVELLLELMTHWMVKNQKKHDTVKQTGAVFRWGINETEDFEMICPMFKMTGDYNLTNVMKRYSPIFITIASPFLKPRNNRIGKFEKLIL